MDRARSTPQPQPAQMEWETADFPNSRVEWLAQKTAETLPHTNVMLVGKMDGMLGMTHP